ncbi:hypothetical protein SAMN06265349_101952 [Flavobacterium resistens]|uniref:Uncharacterized protein n=1 Tax=Flavobacterium resistens TaxID=443612 RepID=A0A521BDH2_9FLAO|nr:hypothetical protein [Flavobacterium resistens]MRX67270.1 hypothetical protein [Flavobacterium resistens]SMO45031.1 hypothetical protein SAMN06265349_101952 [Flavobacterium resistens]
MKKIIYLLILLLVVVSGVVFANRKIKNETIKNTISKPLSVAERKAALKKWEATPDGIMYKKWEASEAGQKVHNSAIKISKSIKNYTNMEAVVTSLSLPAGARLGFGMMVRINSDDYILAFGPEKSGENMFNFNNGFEQLHTLKVNDKIIIRSHHISQAPKYSYPIIMGDYVERDNKTIYMREPSKDGC